MEFEPRFHYIENEVEDLGEEEGEMEQEIDGEMNEYDFDDEDLDEYM